MHRPQRRSHRSSATCRGVAERARPDRALPRRLASSTAASAAKIGRRRLRTCRPGCSRPRRRGRLLRALLAAAGRARPHMLLVHEEEAPCAHVGASPRAHQPRVHIGCQSRGVSSRRVGPRAGEQTAKAGARGGDARCKVVLRARKDLNVTSFDTECRSNISGSCSLSRWIIDVREARQVCVLQLDLRTNSVAIHDLPIQQVEGSRAHTRDNGYQQADSVYEQGCGSMATQASAAA